MKAADALDGYDTAAGNNLPGFSKRRRTAFAAADKINLGPAVVAADRLSVITPGFGVSIFIFAGGAHGKLAHAGPHPVVGHGVQDSQPGSAGRAVNEGVQVAPVFFIEQLRLAFIADGDVRGNEDVAPLLGAFNNVEPGIGGVFISGVDIYF